MPHQLPLLWRSAAVWTNVVLLGTCAEDASVIKDSSVLVQQQWSHSSVGAEASTHGKWRAHKGMLAPATGREGTELSQQDFATGTVRITQGGRYTLGEDIVFDPHHPNATWAGIPQDSVEFPQLAGYFLGFFAAIAIEASNVELDCMGHTIRMSERFHKLQRFFSNIELGSSPFLNGEGPPQFASALTTPGVPVFAKNVTIQNCKLGLSSHHSIHGNNNEGVTLKQVQMFDFEVAGVALNGATQVLMDGLTIGPSLKQTFPAHLSQALFMDHIVNDLMPTETALTDVRGSTKVTLRGQELSVADVFATLRSDLQEYANSGGGPLATLFGDGSGLPDGSAIYGLLLHRSGVAINDFGFCPDDGPSKSDLMVKDVTLRNIEIRDLSVKVDQAIVTTVEGSAALGVAGDPFRMAKNWNVANCHSYTGTSFSDAQIAVGVLRKQVITAGTPETTTKFYFGSSHIPDKIQSWAAGTLSCSQTTEMIGNLVTGSGDTRFLCNKDAMGHINKGVVGMRLGFQESVSVTNVTIANLINEGTENAAPFCTVTGVTYQGLDVRGVSLAHVEDLHIFEVHQEGVFSSTNPDRVFPLTALPQMRADDA
mmetsp:Transcript_107836/g.337655  ORF Transcript_107836/g.337655 Transcript_107836/m.337655 type:complete len:596 (+) Transcript_107836:114-1901(+)